MLVFTNSKAVYHKDKVIRSKCLNINPYSCYITPNFSKMFVITHHMINQFTAMRIEMIAWPEYDLIEIPAEGCEFFANLYNMTVECF